MNYFFYYLHLIIYCICAEASELDIDDLQIQGFLIGYEDKPGFRYLEASITDNEFCSLNVTYEVAVGSPEAEYFELQNTGDKYTSADIVTSAGFSDVATFFFKRMIDGKQFGKHTSDENIMPS